jgi:hypothetical protein
LAVSAGEVNATTLILVFGLGLAGILEEIVTTTRRDWSNKVNYELILVVLLVGPWL